MLTFGFFGANIREAMMLGKPLVVARGTHMDEIVRTHQCGIVVDYDDLPGIETAFQSLENDLSKRLELGRNGRKAYDGYYHWEIMQKRLLELYGELI